MQNDFNWIVSVEFYGSSFGFVQDPLKSIEDVRSDVSWGKTFTFLFLLYIFCFILYL